MIVYFDTSALIKRYLSEPDSGPVAVLWRDAWLVSSSQLLFAELLAAFARKRREQPAHESLVTVARNSFLRDWSSFLHIALDDELDPWIETLSDKHALRGGDAAHLGSALRLRNLAQDDIIFACADDALSVAARAEGLRVAP